MTTMLITATIFDDGPKLAYSVHNSQTDSFSPIHQCDATADAWGYLTMQLPGAYPIDAYRISVIDRRPGTRATSRCCGHSLT
jgi:hypothetical protein